MAKNQISNANTTTINAALATLDPAIFGAVAKDPANFAFIVVLNDGEAGAIVDAVGESVETHVVRRGWGTNVSHVGDALAAIQDAGKTPILVEIGGADTVEGAVVIDHHDSYAGRPAALLQVLHLLGKTPTRFQELVAAFDTSYFMGLEAENATWEEMERVSAYNRKFQLMEQPYGSGNWVPKFTPEVEQAAEEAIAGMVIENGVEKFHFKYDACDAITNPRYQPGKAQNILILCDTGEVDYFGPWEVCEALYDRYGEEGAWHTWKGGETTLPNGRKTGYFGSSTAPAEEVEAMVREWFAQK